MGDICYIENKKVYYDIWGDTFHFRDGFYKSADGTFGVFSTICGDGTFKDSDGNTYTVDTGVIGLVPRNLIGFAEDAFQECIGQDSMFGGILIDSETPVVFGSDRKGKFWCSFNGTAITMDTMDF